MKSNRLVWQSKLVLLMVLPFVAADVVLQGHWWAVQAMPVAIWTFALSALLGIAAYQSRSATSGGMVTGAAITASLMFSTATAPYLPWRTALFPMLTVLALTSLATRLGREKKEHMGTAESRQGRKAAQVAANLGTAAMASSSAAQSWLINQPWLPVARQAASVLFAAGLAALAEAAADTVSSEVGQVMGGEPRMLTTLRRAAPGTDGAVSLAGSMAGAIAAGLVSATGAFALHGGWFLFGTSWAGGVFGLFFDSLLGATLERRGWLNNDSVNFLSTASAAAAALAIMAVLMRLAVLS